MSKFWGVFSAGDESHVVPLDDLYDHDHSGECWCAPTLEEESPTWIHQAFDRRAPSPDST